MRPDFIETFTGRRFRPLDPDPAEVCIEDIAHALSNQCRFSGHTRVHYSVAEHSVHVSRLLDRRGCTRDVQLWGLLHDASEAYLVDIPSPLKSTPAFMPYRVAESTLMGVICERFGLSYEQPQEVSDADAVLLATEVRDLMPAKPAHWDGQLTANPIPGTLHPLGASMAKLEFLATFSRLTEFSTFSRLTR